MSKLNLIKGEEVKWNWTYEEALENGWNEGIYWSNEGDGHHKIKDTNGTIIYVNAIKKVEQSEQSIQEMTLNVLIEIRDLLRKD